MTCATSRAVVEIDLVAGDAFGTGGEGGEDEGALRPVGGSVPSC